MAITKINRFICFTSFILGTFYLIKKWVSSSPSLLSAPPAKTTPEPPPTEKRTPAAPTSAAAKRTHWDNVDETSWESFPASDPPARY